MVNKLIIHVLGTAQDGGFPQAGCKDICCSKIWKSADKHRLPSSIAVIDKLNKKFYLIDITPNIKQQLKRLEKYDCELGGIFITHAHIGHYIGLVELGLEIMNTNQIPVYVMPRMKSFIQTNQPMAQLIENKNIALKDLKQNQQVKFGYFAIKPIEVPHRNELSETVGFKIIHNNKSVIFIPDIDDWESWNLDLKLFVKDNDILFLDGTFYQKDEIKLRDISKIPHPEIIDTMERLSILDRTDRKKVHFIHLNHTNKVLRPNSDEYNNVIKSGFSISQENQIFKI